jgi:hypothetical protein
MIRARRAMDLEESFQFFTVTLQDIEWVVI